MKLLLHNFLKVQDDLVRFESKDFRRSMDVYLLVFLSLIKVTFLWFEILKINELSILFLINFVFLYHNALIDQDSLNTFVFINEVSLLSVVSKVPYLYFDTGKDQCKIILENQKYH